MIVSPHIYFYAILQKMQGGIAPNPPFHHNIADIFFCQALFQPFLYNFRTIWGGISHNVPAVYDGLAARIRKCVAFPGPTNCAGGFAWE
jgi:hypothetical protein